MIKYVIEKNVLDLSYKRNLQLLNAILIIGAGSFITFLAGVFLSPEKISSYSILLTIIGIITFIFYKRVDNILKDISNKIKSLE
jgi:hypothetical protein